MFKTSAKDILLYESCPHRWNLSKHGVKGQKQNFAFYRFSSAMHFAISKALSEIENLFEVFESYWNRYKSYPLVYEGGDNWDSLYSFGVNFLTQFHVEFYEKGIFPVLTEKRLSVVTDEWEFTGQPDFIGFEDKSDSYVVLDYKTTKKKIDELWVRLSDQMTAGAMIVENQFAANLPIKAIVCNFVKETEKIEWLNSVRTKEDIDAYKAKINHFMDLMYIKGYHPRRSLNAFDSSCPWCDVKENCLQPDNALKISLEGMLNSEM